MNNILRAAGYTSIIICVILGWLAGSVWLADTFGAWAGFTGMIAVVVYAWVWWIILEKKA